MGNTPTNNLGIKNKEPRACRVAYSLNNTQPVECTIISDQPFFYMDDVVDYDDEGILCGEFETTPALEAEMKELRQKIDSYDRFSLEFSQPRDKALQDFITQSSCFGKDTKSEDNLIIEEQLRILSKSSHASGLLDFAEKHNVELKASNHVDDVFYDRDGSQILINSNLEKIKCSFALIRALRMHWQHRNGTLVHPLSFHPDHAILVNRAQLADLSIAVVRTAWELKLSNDKEFWAAIEGSDLADLGRAFAREALTDFRTLNNGKASSAVFETWFLSERCGYQDKILIQKMLSDYKGYAFEHQETSKLVSIDLICQLGEQPFGKNYLASYAQMILNDPIFTDVRDRSNANFLWFIKFERSFAEVEQELQSSDFDQKRDVHHAFFNQDDNTAQRSEKNLTSGSNLSEDTRHDTNVIAIDFAANRSEQSEHKS